MWILISWLLMKPADQDLHSFQKMINMGSVGEGLRSSPNCLMIDGKINFETDDQRVAEIWIIEAPLTHSQ